MAKAKVNPAQTDLFIAAPTGRQRYKPKSKSTASDEYITPPALSDLAKKIFGGPIDFDPYACKGQIVPARDGLTIHSEPEPWPTTGHWWVNIPFSKSSETMNNLTAHFAANPAISALVLTLAAPSTVYWRQCFWSKVGPRRIAWIPRFSFLRVDDHGIAQKTKDVIRSDIALSLWTSDPKLVIRFERTIAEWNPATRSPSKDWPIHVSVGGQP